MKKLLTTFGLVILLCLGYAYANPIAINGDSHIEKTWEHCLVYVDASTARVSCAVGYVTKKRATTDLHFTVPVYWPSGDKIDLKRAADFIAPRIECDGVVYRPANVRFASDDSMPIPGEPPLDRVKIDCDFLIKFPKDDRFSFVSSYSQPLVSDVAYYLPLFEQNPKPEMAKECIITFFPSGINELELLTVHEKRAKAQKTRVSITPKHRELIAVKIKRAEKSGADQPTTRPESKPEGGDKPQPNAERRSR